MNKSPAKVRHNDDKELEYDPLKKSGRVEQSQRFDKAIQVHFLSPESLSRNESQRKEAMHGGGVRLPACAQF